MPGKKKKPRKLKPFEKAQDFRTGYEKLCEQYEVDPLESVCQVYDEIISKGKSVRKLPLLFQFADEPIPAASLRPLVDAYQSFEVRVRFLSFMNTNSGDDGLHMLAHALRPPLEVAGIAYHAENAGPSGCRAFARAAVASRALSVLEFDFNPGIGDDGAAGLCHYGHCPTLTKLSLRFCGIGDRGAEAIGRWLALPQCNLKELLLQGNRIGPPGAVAFGGSLPSNKSLNRLDLSDNLFAFDQAALEALHDGIQGCPSLTAVTILNRMDCPEGIDQKYLDLTTEKPLGECVMTPKMETFVFQNMAAIAMVNKKKILKAQKAAKKGAPPEAAEQQGSARDCPQHSGRVETPVEPT